MSSEQSQFGNRESSDSALRKETELLVKKHDDEYSQFCDIRDTLKEDGGAEINSVILGKIEDIHDRLKNALNGLLLGKLVKEEDLDRVKKIEAIFSDTLTKLIDNLVSEQGYKINVTTIEEAGQENLEEGTVNSAIPSSDEVVGESIKDEKTVLPNDNLLDLAAVKSTESSVDEEVKAVPVVESIESKIESSPKPDINRLVYLYKNGNNKVFRDYSVDEIKFKRFKDIKQEISLVLESEGFGKDKISIFMQEIVGRLGYDISNLGRAKSLENDIEKKKVINKEIKEKYQELLQAVAAFLQTEKIDEEEGQVTKNDQDITQSLGDAPQSLVSVDESLPTLEVVPSIEEVEIKLNEKIKSFENLRDNLFGQGLNQEISEAIVRGERVIDRIKNYSENDRTRAFNDKQLYLKFLENIIDILENAPLVRQVGVRTPVTIEGQAVEIKDQVNDPVKENQERKNWKEAKTTFREKEKEYKSALSDYYNDPSFKAKIRASLGSVKKLFGINPDLPPALIQMQSEYKQLRAVYAESLDKALTERSQATDENKEYSLESDEAKAAFGRKFILKPNQEMLALQQPAMSTESQKRIGSIMQTLSKYKWHTRVGSVAFAGALGAASGGVGLLVAGASWQAWKIAASAAAGAGAAKITNKSMQGRVDEARLNLSKVEQAASKSFSLDKLNSLEQELENAQFAKDTKERQQKVATVAAAVAAGGVTGASLGSFSTESATTVESGKIDAEAMQKLVALDAKPPVAESSIISPQVSVLHYSPDGTVTGETLLKNISLAGLKDGALSSAQQLEVNQFLQLSTNDILSAHPNLSQTAIGQQLLEKLENKYGDSVWWKETNISKVNFGEVEKSFGGASLASQDGNVEIGKNQETSIAKDDIKTESATEVAKETTTQETKITPYNPEASKIYVVQKGDTLWDIVKERYAEELKDVPLKKQNEILDTLFDRVRADQELVKSLGLKNPNQDIDLIYPKEELNLTGIENELKILIEREQVFEDFKRNTILPIEPDAAEKIIPIKVAEPPVAAESLFTASNPTNDAIGFGSEYLNDSKVTTENSPSIKVPEAVVAPKIFSVNGNYLNHPEYKSFIQQTFGSEKLFTQSVNKMSMAIDAKTYDFFDSSPFFGGGNYESPFTFMKEMSLKEIQGLEEMPNNELRSLLEKNNVKYDTYLAWLDQIDKMKPVIPNQPTTTLGDLFGRYVAENHIVADNVITRKV